MGYAQFVGRVGALAVALGVTNVVGHPLVAWAEEPSAESSTKGGAEPAPSTGTPDKPAETQSADPTTAPSHEPVDTEEDAPEPEAPDIEETQTEETEVSEVETPDPTTPPAPETEEAQAPETDPTTVEVPETKDPHPSEVEQAATPPADDNDDADQSRFVARALTVSGIDEQSLDAPLPIALAIPVSADLVTSSAAPTAAVTITKVDPVTVEETHPFRSLVLGFLGIFGFDPTPGATNDALLASLWAAYRGYERRFENESPTVSGATVLSTSQTENGYTAVTISVGFTDPDGDTLHFTTTNGHAGTLTANGDGTYTYLTNTPGTDIVTITANDDDGTGHLHGLLGWLFKPDAGHTRTVTLTLNVTAPTNTAPVAGDDTARTAAGTPVVIHVLTNDTDPDNDSLSIDTYTGVAHGTLTLHADGSFTYAPNQNYYGTDEFTYAVTDGAAVSNTATVTITIDRPDNVLIASPEVGQYTDVLAVQPTGRYVYISDTLNGNVKVFDTTDNTVVATIPVLSGKIVFSPDGATAYAPLTGYGAAAKIAVIDTSTSTSTITDTVTVPLPGNLGIHDVAVSPNGQHLYALMYTADQEQLVVLNSSDFGVISTTDVGYNAQALTLSPDGAKLYFSAQDPGQGLGVRMFDTITNSLSKTDLPASTAYNVPMAVGLDGHYLYVGRSDYHADDNSFSTDLLVYETSTLSLVQTIPIEATINQRSNSIYSLAVTPSGNRLYVANWSGDVLVLDTADLSSIGHLFGGPGPIVISPDATRAYMVSANRGYDSRYLQIFSINESASVNHAPHASDDAIATDEDAPVTVSVATLLANDTDAEHDPLSISTVSHGDHGITDLANGVITYTPDADYNGTDTFTYTVTDGTTASQGTVTVTVNPVDDAPVIQSVVTTALSTTSWRITVTAYDPDGDPLDITLTPTDPEHVTITPEVNLLSARMFSFAAFDAGPAPTTATYIAEVDPDYALSHPGEPVGATVGVTDGNSPEVTQQQQVATTTNLLGFGDRNGYGLVDIPAAPVGLSYTKIVVGLANSVALLSDGTAVLYGITANGMFEIPALPENVTYTDAAYSDIWTIFLLRSDGAIVAAGVADPLSKIPAAPDGVTYIGIAGTVGVTALTRSDGAVTLVNLNDSTSETVTAGDDLTYVQAAVASDHIVLLRSNGTAVAYPTPTSFMPPPDYGQLTIPVLPNAMTYTQVAAGRGFTVLLRSDGTVLTFGKKDANYTDVPPLPPGMTYTEISASDNSAVALALRSDGAVVEFGNDNVLTTVPNPPAGVVYTHIYAGLDGAAVAATSHTVGLSAGPDTLTLNEDTGREVTVLANDIDPEGHPLTVTDVTPGLHGTTWVNPDGSISYTPALDYYGLDAFAYTLSNGVTSVIGGVTVKVDQVNDAPRVQDAVFNGVTAGSVLTASLADKVSDPDPPVPPFNGNLQVLVVTQPSLGSLVISGFTDFTYTAPTDLGGATSTSFIYLVTGGSGASDYATVTINFI